LSGHALLQTVALIFACGHAEFFFENLVELGKETLDNFNLQSSFEDWENWVGRARFVHEHSTFFLGVTLRCLLACFYLIVWAYIASFFLLVTLRCLLVITDWSTDDHGCCIFSSLSAYGGCIEIEGRSPRDVDDSWTISLLMKLAPPLSPLQIKWTWKLEKADGQAAELWCWK